MQMEQMKAQFEAQRMQMEHNMRKEVEMIRAQATLGFRTEDQEFKESSKYSKKIGKMNVSISKLLSSLSSSLSEKVIGGD